MHIVLARLADHGVQVAKGLSRLCADIAATGPRPHPAAPTRQLVDKALITVARGVRWAVALSQILAGRYPLPRCCAARPPQPAPAPQAVRPIPPMVLRIRPIDTGLARKADSWMRRVFATRSIGYIIDHICSDLGIDDEDEDLWPIDLAGLRQTPADLLAAPPPEPEPNLPHATTSAPAPPDPPSQDSDTPTTTTTTTTTTDPPESDE